MADAYGKVTHRRRRLWFDRYMATERVDTELVERTPGRESRPVVRRAHEELAVGNVSKARALLRSDAANSRDPEALRLLGELLHRSGDLAGAGAVWFAAAARGPAVDEAVAAWRAAHHDDFVALWESLPAGARAEPLSPRLAALRDKAKAQEAEQQARAFEEQARAREEAALKARSDALPDRSAAQAAPTEAPPDEEPPEDRTMGEDVTNRPAPKAATRGSARSSREKRSAPKTRPAPPSLTSRRQRRTDTGETGEHATQPSGRFDSAKVIAWILVAAFVFCAVVGLITVLRWMLPGG